METEGLEQELKANLEKIEQIRALIPPIVSRNGEIIIELIRIFHHVSAGDVVMSRGKEYKIEHVELRWSDYEKTAKPWVYGFTKKKDGSWGTQSHCLYGNWELPK